MNDNGISWVFSDEGCGYGDGDGDGDGGGGGGGDGLEVPCSG